MLFLIDYFLLQTQTSMIIYLTKEENKYTLKQEVGCRVIFNIIIMKLIFGVILQNCYFGHNSQLSNEIIICHHLRHIVYKGIRVTTTHCIFSKPHKCTSQASVVGHLVIIPAYSMQCNIYVFTFSIFYMGILFTSEFGISVPILIGYLFSYKYN